MSCLCSMRRSMATLTSFLTFSSRHEEIVLETS
jgi:hypothetical protein